LREKKMKSLIFAFALLAFGASRAATISCGDPATGSPVVSSDLVCKPEGCKVLFFGNWLEVPPEKIGTGSNPSHAVMWGHFAPGDLARPVHWVIDCFLKAG
jgi:hypothetical protein